MEILNNREEDSFVSVEGFQNGAQTDLQPSNQSLKRSLSPSAYDENSNSKRSHQQREHSHDRRHRERSRSPRRDRSRDRRRVDKPSRHSDKYKWERTCYVSNIPYDVRWTDLKDMFREECKLEPLYCEVYERDGKSLGVATIEFKSEADAQKVVEKMHHFELSGRKISVRIDQEGYKTRQARDMAGDNYLSNGPKGSTSNVNTDSAAAAALLASTLASSLTGSSGPNLLNLLGMANPVAPPPIANQSQPNLLNQLASQLKVEGPVTNRLFVASLDYRVDESKLREVFGLAGHVTSVSLFKDRDNRSRGLAVVEYDSSFEALNAVSMFNNQVLMDRKMTVRFDTKPGDEYTHKDKSGNLNQVGGSKLPSGLKSIGNSLGLNSLGSSSNPVTSNPLTLGALTALTGLGSGLNDNFNTGLGLLGNFNGSQSSQSSQPSISKIFVKNIPFTWDERRLREKFRQAGNIEYVEIKMRDGKSRGCGMIRFTSPQQAQKAVELFNGSRFEGRTLEVKLDTY